MKKIPPTEKELENLAAQKGNAYLHGMLKEIDEPSALSIHENNVKRVIRALEFYKMTGEKISAHNETERKKRPLTTPVILS